MHRRHVMSLSACTAFIAFAPPLALSQVGTVKRIGVLSFLPRERWPALWHRTFEGLPRHGWVEVRNVQFEYRDGVTDPQGLYGAARRLVETKVDLIAALLDDAAFAAKGATKTIPIAAISAFPVEIGLVQSMPRPGGNITGVSFQASEENGRVLALLRDIRPGLARVGVPANLSDPGWKIWFDGYVKPAGPAGIRIVALPLPFTPNDIGPMLDVAAREDVQALVMPILPLLSKAIWQQITAWAIEHKVVTRGPLQWRDDVVMTFGTNLQELERLYVAQIDRLLRGANPADTPFLQVNTWETVVNLSLARAVGWPIPRSVLIQATEVIQ
jgi:putative tryptophan/tyrosine transport system substrate-binding protein